jgi:Transposase DDE domain
MKSKDGFVQAYNAQAAVDGEAQIIVAHDVTQSAGDCGQLIPMTDAIEINLGRKPEQLSADAGYCSEANLEALEDRNIDAYVATGRARDAVAGHPGAYLDAVDGHEPADILVLVDDAAFDRGGNGHLRRRRRRPLLRGLAAGGQRGEDRQHERASGGERPHGFSVGVTGNIRSGIDGYMKVEKRLMCNANGSHSVHAPCTGAQPDELTLAPGLPP